MATKAIFSSDEEFSYVSYSENFLQKFFYMNPTVNFYSFFVPGTCWIVGRLPEGPINWELDLFVQTNMKKVIFQSPRAVFQHHFFQIHVLDRGLDFLNFLDSLRFMRIGQCIDFMHLWHTSEGKILLISFWFKTKNYGSKFLEF